MSWTPAKSSHSPQRSLPTKRVDQRARLGLVAGHGPCRPLDQALALGDLAQERGAVRIRRAGDAGNHGRRIRREAACGCQSGREAQAGARLARVADRLGDVPVLLAAGCPEGHLGGCLDERREGRRQGVELRHDPVRAAEAGPPPDLAPDADELAFVDPPPGRHDVGCTRLQGIDPRGHGQAQSRSNRSTGRTKTVAPPTSTSSG